MGQVARALAAGATPQDLMGVLHQQGALTDSEFAAAKAKLPGG